MFVWKDKRWRKILRLFIYCPAVFGDASLQKPTEKQSTCSLRGWHWYRGTAADQILVSCVGVSLALRKFPSEAAIPGWIQWGFCPSSVWDQGFVCAWCVLCTLQSLVCRSGLCVSFLGEVKYLFWRYLVFISLDIKTSAALCTGKLMSEGCGKSELKIHLWLGIGLNHVIFKSI